MSFTFSGPISGSFTAAGIMPEGLGEQVLQTWAAGELDLSPGRLIVAASRPRDASSHDAVNVWISRTTVGSWPIERTFFTPCPAASSCVIAAIGMTNVFSSWLHFCELTSGTTAITAISGTRATGTFEGTGMCFSYTGGQSSFSITNGTFNVAVVSDVPG
jgi:hypothetical protein